MSRNRGSARSMTSSPFLCPTTCDITFLHNCTFINPYKCQKVWSSSDCIFKQYCIFHYNQCVLACLGSFFVEH
uniref:Uncharacterized protein n=1 Tax=Paramormyrops kingsleyae TaxID=1676925 RepID=A0A3B3T0V2_9TELE